MSGVEEEWPLTRGPTDDNRAYGPSLPSGLPVSVRRRRSERAREEKPVIVVDRGP